MDEPQVAWNEKTAKVIIQNLEKRRMEGSYAANAAQALEEVLAMSPRKLRFSAVVPDLVTQFEIK